MELTDAVAKGTAMIEKRDGQLQRRNEQLQVLERRKMELADAVAKGTATIEKRDGQLQRRNEQLQVVEQRKMELTDAVAKGTATIEKRDGQLQRRNEQLQVLERRKMELADAVAKGTATIEKRDGQLQRRNEQLRVVEQRKMELTDAVVKGTATIEKRDGQLQRRNEQLQVLERRKMELADAVAKGTATIEKRDTQVRELEECVGNLNAKAEEATQGKKDLMDVLEKQTAAIERRDYEIRVLTQEVTKLSNELATRMATIKERENQIQILERRRKKFDVQLQKQDVAIHDLLQSNSWKVTAPVRATSRHIRWLGLKVKQSLNSVKSLNAFGTFVAGPRIGQSNKESVRPEQLKDTTFSIENRSRSTTTYLVPASWWVRHNNTVESIAKSRKTVIVVGDIKGKIPRNVTVVGGPRARALALCSVTTETAIEISPEASCEVTEFPAWEDASPKDKLRRNDIGNMLTPSAVIDELITEQEETLKW